MIHFLTMRGRSREALQIAPVLEEGEKEEPPSPASLQSAFCCAIRWKTFLLELKIGLGTVALFRSPPLLWRAIWKKTALLSSRTSPGGPAFLRVRQSKRCGSLWRGGL